MDIGTILGIMSGAALVFIAISQESGFALFINLPSMMIVGGGTFAATLISYPLREVFGVFTIISQTFFIKSMRPEVVIHEFMRIVRMARKKEILSVGLATKNIRNDFFIKAIKLAIGKNMPPSNISKVLKSSVALMHQRHSNGQAILSDLGIYAPAFGMIGTVIGLIQMLANLDDPTSIGPKMALALVTTFYGTCLANLLFIPMSVKLARRSEMETLSCRILIEGIDAFLEKDSFEVIEMKMNTFLSEKILKELNTKKEAAKKEALRASLDQT